jgi:hypothetical protein
VVRGGRKALVLAAVATLGVSTSAAAGAAVRAAPAGHQARLARGVDPSSTGNVLNGVSGDSATDAWAVGSYVNNTTKVTDTLLEHWDGSAWSQVASPSPGTSNVLSSVSADSPTDAWAVGSYRTKSGFDSLILRWNGSSWAQVPSPSPAGFPDNELTGVSAISGTDAWAVGFSRMHGQTRTLVLQWNGTAWADVPSPDPGSTDSELDSVSAASATDAWAAGTYVNNKGHATDSLTLQWNGTAWTHVPSPSPSVPGRPTILSGISAISPTDAWAAGTFSGLTTGGPEDLVLHWNGKTWRLAEGFLPQPKRRQPHIFAAELNGISAESATEAWTVGDGDELAPKRTPLSTQTLHWNGKAWSSASSPNQRPGNDQLNAVSTVSPTDAWAVGAYSHKSITDTIILHWNGTTWSAS